MSDQTSRGKIPQPEGAKVAPIIGAGIHGCIQQCAVCRKGCPICHPCNPEDHKKYSIDNPKPRIGYL